MASDEELVEMLSDAALAVATRARDSATIAGMPGLTAEYAKAAAELINAMLSLRGEQAELQP
jgi:hypothetical protein